MIKSDRFPVPLFHLRVQNLSLVPLLIGLMVGIWPLRAEEQPEPPPDPLAPSAEPAPNQRGYFGGGTVPESLKPSSRLRVGDFALGATAAFGTLYDDNVEASDDERDEDVFLSFSPSVRAQSTYARHSIGFGAGATTGTALKDTGDDFFDWQVGADGRVDLSRSSKINGSVGYSRDVEDDEDVDSEDRNGDTPIHRINANLGYEANGERLGFGVGGSVSRLDIEDSDFNDRDSTTIGLSGRLRYKWSDALTLTAGPGYRYSTFDEDVADDGEGRDAERYSFQVGAGFRASRTISTSFGLGYSILNFDDPDRDDEDSAVGSAGLTWAPGLGTTLDLRASRSLEISVEDGEDARNQTTGSATLTHRVQLGSRSALSSSLGLSVTRLSDFDRTDRNLVAGLTYGYRLAEHAFLTTSYRFRQRESDQADADFYRNLVSVGVTLTY